MDGTTGEVDRNRLFSLMGKPRTLRLWPGHSSGNANHYEVAGTPMGGVNASTIIL
jgi:hypothetical protein